MVAPLPVRVSTPVPVSILYLILSPQLPLVAAVAAKAKDAPLPSTVLSMTMLKITDSHFFMLNPPKKA